MYSWDFFLLSFKFNFILKSVYLEFTLNSEVGSEKKKNIWFDFHLLKILNLDIYLHMLRFSHTYSQLDIKTVLSWWQNFILL